MKRISTLIREGTYAPFLVAVQPVLYMYSVNMTVFSPKSFWRIVVFLAMCLSVVIYFLRRKFQDRELMNALLTFYVVVFFAFGKIAAKLGILFTTDWVRQNLLASLLFGVLLWSGTAFVLKMKDKSKFYILANIWAVSAFGSSLFTYYQVSNFLAHSAAQAPVSESAVPSAVPAEDDRPDVYYIIFDAYGGQDILQEYYGVDNQPFLNALRARGFFVAEASRANYLQTSLSLSSSLNMDYLQTLQTEGVDISSQARAYMAIRASRVENFLVGQGYASIAIENKFFTVSEDNQLYFDILRHESQKNFVSLETLVVDSSMARMLAFIPAVRELVFTPGYARHREQMLFMFDTLSSLPELHGNFFTVAHIISPHPPFVFDEDGELGEYYVPFSLRDASHFMAVQSREVYISGYAEQVQYVNQKILAMVDTLLSAPGPRPIIVLQGDHGPGAYLDWESYEDSIIAERFGILNAYYFPDGNYAALASDVSPVNTFRVIFNQYFEQELPILDNHYYFSTWSKTFDFIEVTHDLDFAQESQPEK